MAHRADKTGVADVKSALNMDQPPFRDYYCYVVFVFKTVSSGTHKREHDISTLPT